MEQEPTKTEREKSIEHINFEIVQKNDQVKKDVMDLLHQYPDHFVHGLFEQYAEQDFQDSDIVLAHDGNTAIGCLMFNRTTNEYNWLAIKRDIPFSKTEIAKRLFESFYPTIKPGTVVHLFVNTEDAKIPDRPNFSGKNFEPARKLYTSMGLGIKEENRIEDKYGPGAHAYRVEWIPNKLVEHTGIEPVTPSMPWKCSTS